MAASAAATACGRWLVMADGAIVLVGRHLHDHRAEAGPELGQQVEVLGVGVLGGGEDGDAALEQIGRGVARPDLLAAGQGMAAQEAAAAGQPVVQGLDDRLLRAAGVGNQRALAAVLGRLANVVDDPADGRADDDQVGLGHALGQVDRRVGHGPDPAGDAQAGLAASDADDPLGQSPLAQGQADRPADQADADDGDSCGSVSWPWWRLPRRWSTARRPL